MVPLFDKWHHSQLTGQVIKGNNFRCLFELSFTPTFSDSLSFLQSTFPMSLEFTPFTPSLQPLTQSKTSSFSRFGCRGSLLTVLPSNLAPLQSIHHTLPSMIYFTYKCNHCPPLWDKILQCLCITFRKVQMLQSMVYCTLGNGPDLAA